MELKDFVGNHTLDAVDETENPRDRDARAVLFRLNGFIYLCSEDPEDGYRSSMKNIEIVTTEPNNVFSSVPVRGEYRPNLEDGQYFPDSFDVICFVNVRNDKVVLEIGTEHMDNYYPSYVGRFHPSALI